MYPPKPEYAVTNHGDEAIMERVDENDIKGAWEMYQSTVEAGRLLTRLLNPICNPHKRSRGLVVRASAARSGGRGFKSRPGHTKDFKNGTCRLLVRRSTLKERSGRVNMGSYQWTKPPL